MSKGLHGNQMVVGTRRPLGCFSSHGQDHWQDHGYRLLLGSPDINRPRRLLGRMVKQHRSCKALGRGHIQRRQPTSVDYRIAAQLA